MLIRRSIVPIVALIAVLSACGGAPAAQTSNSPTTAPVVSAGAPTAETPPTPIPPTAQTAPTLAPPTLAPITPTPTGFSKKIDIGGRGLFMTCLGTGSPPVVLEAASGGEADYLFDVLLAVSKVTQVCTYDRAGAGKSDPVQGPRAAHELVTDVYTLLKTAGITGPYVLAGHSFGGELVRLFASEHPADTAGLISIEGTPNAFAARVAAILPQQGSAWLKLIFEGNGIDMTATTTQMSRAAALPHVPFIVLTAENRADMWPAEWSADKTKQLDQMWLELQKDMVQLVPGATQIIVPSGHFIPSQQPVYVIKAIVTVVKAVRGQK